MKTRASVAVLAGLLLVLFAVYVLLGSYTVTIPDFVKIVAARLTGGDPIPGASFIVMENKLPRAVLGAMVGLAFGLSGALFQTMLRNPLASPDVIGISSGASAAAVVAIVIFGLSGAGVALFALLGALAVAVLIYSIAGGKRGKRSGSSSASGVSTKFILGGVGVAAAMQAVVNFLMTRADVRTASEVLIWLNGSLNSSSWERISILGMALIILLPAAAILAKPLRMLELGDDAAAALGVRVPASRFAVVITAVGLAAVATAATGPVSFVAFLAGPIARRITGSNSLAAAALTGALLVLAADFFAYNIAPLLLHGTALPVGVVTGALGAPFLLWLLAAPQLKRKDA
ncbi:FecCD family ABC transporter permease [Pseudarthrobacter sp. J1763]|uniref:FecCD family ABC transporter permease n=1 Tax=Pseudarthrobacter sp. J1763 TaxID=3420445 RepID=UPI003D2721EF